MDFSFSKMSKRALDSTQTPSQCERNFFRGVAPWGVNLTTHRHLLPKLRMNRELHDYASMAWTGTSSHLHNQIIAGPL
jgi:hypothetical protein